MRLQLGAIPEIADLPAEDGWVKLREPPLWVVRWILALPLSLVLVLLSAVFVTRYTEITIEGLSGGGLIAVYVATIAMHELVHAAIHPDRGLSDRTVVGLWPSRLVFFAHYEGARSKGNFTLGIIAPFLVLTILPLMAAHQFGWSSWILGAVIILNASVSSVDVLGFFIALFGLPGSSIVRNRGWHSYWRSAGGSVSSNNPLQPIARDDARSG
jgi:hypothetical protein